MCDGLGRNFSYMNIHLHAEDHSYILKICVKSYRLVVTHVEYFPQLISILATIPDTDSLHDCDVASEIGEIEKSRRFRRQGKNRFWKIRYLPSPASLQQADLQRVPQIHV